MQDKQTQIIVMNSLAELSSQVGDLKREIRRRPPSGPEFIGPSIGAIAVIVAAIIGGNLVQLQIAEARIENLQEAYIDSINNVFQSNLPPELTEFVVEGRARLLDQAAIADERIKELEGELEALTIALQTSQESLQALEQ